MMNDKKWYDNANIVVNLIIGVIIGIIIFSQSFAIGGELTLFGSVINHNSIYFLILIYYLFLKFSFGKKYFNYLSIFLIFIYSIFGITSLLTVVQAFSLNTVLSFTLDFLLLVYLIHTFLRDTRLWSELRLYHSPFNELTNEWLFYSIIVISTFLLAVNLISTVALSGVVISILDYIFYLLFSRYIYLYREYLDTNKIDIDNDGNFNSIREDIKSTVYDAEDKIKDTIDKVDSGEMSETIKKKVEEVSHDAEEYFDKESKDEKIIEKIKQEEMDDSVNEEKPKNKKSTKRATSKRNISKKKGDE